MTEPDPIRKAAEACMKEVREVGAVVYEDVRMLSTFSRVVDIIERHMRALATKVATEEIVMVYDVDNNKYVALTDQELNCAGDPNEH